MWTRFGPISDDTIVARYIHAIFHDDRVGLDWTFLLLLYTPRTPLDTSTYPLSVDFWEDPSSADEIHIFGLYLGLANVDRRSILTRYPRICSTLHGLNVLTSSSLASLGYLGDSAGHAWYQGRLWLVLFAVFPPFVYNLGDEGSDDNSTPWHACHTPLNAPLVGGLQRCSLACAPLKLEIAYNEIHGLS
jgi:hypothetical protein